MRTQSGTLSAEWRTNGEVDTILIVDEANAVREALMANSDRLSSLLTEPGDLGAWRGGITVEGEKRRPDAWGNLVLARANSGEVLDMDPRLFWEGIYFWFRSRGVDYDTPRN